MAESELRTWASDDLPTEEITPEADKPRVWVIFKATAELPLHCLPKEWVYKREAIPDLRDGLGLLRYFESEGAKIVVASEEDERIRGLFSTANLEFGFQVGNLEALPISCRDFIVVLSPRVETPMNLSDYAANGTEVLCEQCLEHYEAGDRLRGFTQMFGVSVEGNSLVIVVRVPRGERD